MTTDRIYDEAARWVDRQQDEAMDWDGFTAWLEADPRHRLAYDELALIDLQLEQYSPELAGAAEADKPIIHTQPIRWRWWVGLAAGAIAAAAECGPEGGLQLLARDPQLQGRSDVLSHLPQ